MTDKIYAHVWQTDYGLHEIPEEFSGVKFTKSGMPDKRYKRYDEIMAWANSLDKELVE